MARRPDGRRRGRSTPSVAAGTFAVHCTASPSSSRTTSRRPTRCRRLPAPGRWPARSTPSTRRSSRVCAAGAIVLGKSNLSEWANFRSTHSTSGWSAVGGQTRNAYAADRSPSGSSAGSAVATAASLCAAAIGSETNGSVLAPASVNGLVGLKPALGLVSGEGIVPISPRQDTAGPMARTVADAALLATIIAERPLGYGRHGTVLDAFRLRGLRLGALPLPVSAHPEVARLYGDARQVFEREGATVIELTPPVLDELKGAELQSLLTEFKDAINRYLARLDPARVPTRSLADLIAFNRREAAVELAGFGQELFELAEACGPLTSESHLEGLATLRRGADTDGLAALLAQHDVEVLPAPGNGPAERIDPIWGDRSDDGGWPSIANGAAIAGYPSLTVPAGLGRGLPVGIVLVGGRDQEGLVLQVAGAFERASAARTPRYAVPT